MELCERLPVSTKRYIALAGADNGFFQAAHHGIDAAAIAAQTTAMRDFIQCERLALRLLAALSLDVIRRREETNATRSLLNTAKVMESHAVELRLKEQRIASD